MLQPGGLGFGYTAEVNPTIGDALDGARRRLAATPFGAEPREALLLLGHVLRWTEAQILAHPEEPLDTRDAERFETLLARRLAGEPIAYILGVKEFYGRSFAVDPRVLVPRPESEHLIETVLEIDLPTSPTILDLGTGSGILACTLAAEIPGSRVVATDVSIGALSVARRNATSLGLGHRLHLVAADLATALTTRDFDLVVSNPPYIARSEAGDLSTEILDFEPHAALFAGVDGTAIHRRLLSELGELPPGTQLVLEIGADQGETLGQLAAGSPFELVEVRKDLAGRSRIALFERR